MVDSIDDRLNRFHPLVASLRLQTTAVLAGDRQRASTKELLDLLLRPLDDEVGLVLKGLERIFPLGGGLSGLEPIDEVDLLLITLWLIDRLYILRTHLDVASRCQVQGDLLVLVLDFGLWHRESGLLLRANVCHNHWWRTSHDLILHLRASHLHAIVLISIFRLPFREL